MSENGDKKSKLFLKVYFSLVISVLFIMSSVVRINSGQEVDQNLCFLFAFIAGLPWGANLIDVIRK